MSFDLWTVRVTYTEPTYELHTGRPPTPFTWTWSGFASGFSTAQSLALTEFKQLTLHSGVGWVMEVQAVHAWQERPSALSSGSLR